MQPLHAPTRRRLLAQGLRLGLGLSALVSLASLSACGFRLKGQATFDATRLVVIGPGQGPTVERGVPGPSGEINAPVARYLQTADGSSIVNRLRQELSIRHGLELVETIPAAQRVVRLLKVETTSTIIGYSGSGRPREIELLMIVDLRIEDNAGRPLAPTDRLRLRRRVSFNENDVLGSQATEVSQRAGMESDMIDQLVRRLASLRA